MLVQLIYYFYLHKKMLGDAHNTKIFSAGILQATDTLLKCLKLPKALLDFEQPSTSIGRNGACGNIMKLHYIAVSGKKRAELANRSRKNIGKLAQEFHHSTIPVEAFLYSFSCLSWSNIPMAERNLVLLPLIQVQPFRNITNLLRGLGFGAPSECLILPSSLKIRYSHSSLTAFTLL
jgi:hypothetical protein